VTHQRKYQGGDSAPLQQVYDVSGFCKAHFISRAFFYKLQQLGRGPQIMKVGRRTLVSSAAAAEWVERMERSRKVTRDGD
jgi:hypothetical protein